MQTIPLNDFRVVTKTENFVRFPYFSVTFHGRNEDGVERVEVSRFCLHTDWESPHAVHMPSIGENIHSNHSWSKFVGDYDDWQIWRMVEAACKVLNRPLPSGWYDESHDYFE